MTFIGDALDVPAHIPHRGGALSAEARHAERALASVRADVQVPFHVHDAGGLSPSVAAVTLVTSES